MKTLTFDCAVKTCSAAFFADGAIMARAFLDRGLTHSETLMPMIDFVLGGETPDEILVTRGPGSFTGLRTGIALAKGLSMGWKIPAFGVSALEVIALGAGEPQKTVVAEIDARRGNIYCAAFLGGARLCEDAFADRAEFLAKYPECVTAQSVLAENIISAKRLELAPAYIRAEDYKKI